MKNQLLPALDGFPVQGRLLYDRPIGPILRGFCVEISAFSNADFFLECFVQPLYVPCSHLVFSYGKRLHDPLTKSRGWHMDGDQTLARAVAVMKQGGLPWLRQLSSAVDLAATLGVTLGSPCDFRLHSCR